MVTKLGELFNLAKAKEKKTISVAAAQDKDVLSAVTEAVRMGIVHAILVGDEEKIRKIAKEEMYELKDLEIIDEKDVKKAAIKAVQLISEGKAQFIMKGMLGTSDLLRAVLSKDANLKQEELLSHVMVYEASNYHKLIMLTDGGMVPYPELKEKVQIINNAVKLCSSLGIENPKVAPICAVEVVNPAMQATIDASVLSQMNKRGQIKGCIIDGPLALDNAISKEAAIHKGITSEVAGDADILLVPNIESGNFLGKALTYFAKAENAGVIIGAKCPVVLVSRADTSKSKLYSIALGSLLTN